MFIENILKKSLEHKLIYAKGMWFIEDSHDSWSACDESSINDLFNFIYEIIENIHAKSVCYNNKEISNYDKCFYLSNIKLNIKHPRCYKELFSEFT